MNQKEHKPWHSGETEIHRLVGNEDKMRKIGNIAIRDHMPNEHRNFFSNLPFVVLSALDSAGDVWVLLRARVDSFMHSPTPEILTICSTSLGTEADDVALGVGDKISVLGIEFHSKRRNRMNGSISRVKHNCIEITVEQSYGNCPRYIHPRKDTTTHWQTSSQQIEQYNQLNDRDKQLINASDMLFLGSRSPSMDQNDRATGVDVNHRGGEPGFVRILDSNTIVIPDYQGNNFFNTYGNIQLDSRMSVLFVNLLTGDVLTLLGQGEIFMNDSENTQRYGSHRYIKMNIKHVRWAGEAFPLRYTKTEESQDPPKLPT